MCSAATATPVTVLTGEHLGQSHGKNRALGRATGELIAFLDADDLWLPRRLDRQLAVLAEDPSIEAVFGATDEFIDAGGAEHVRGRGSAPSDRS